MSPANTVPPVCQLPYTVGAGDYWIRIADAADITLGKLLRANLATVAHAAVSGRRHLSPRGGHAPGATDCDNGRADHHRAPSTSPPSTVTTKPATTTTTAPTTTVPVTAPPLAGRGRGDDQGGLAGRSRGQGARDRVARERVPIATPRTGAATASSRSTGALTSRGSTTSASRHRPTCSTPAPTSGPPTRCTNAPADGDPGAAEPSSPSTAAGLDSSNAALVAQRIEHLTTDQKVGSSNLSGRTIQIWSLSWSDTRAPLSGGLGADRERSGLSLRHDVEPPPSISRPNRLRGSRPARPA